MNVFKDKVAVITGAASGIGKGIAERCLREGMKVVIADIEEDALHQTAKDIDSSGTNVLSMVTDVSKADDIEELAKKAIATYGKVHLLFNNAGVSGGKSVWESTVNDWEWVLNVNLWSVINGIRTFVPIMLGQNEECHIVTTSSLSGLVTYHPDAPYHLTKHGIMALSELLYHDMAMRGSKIGVSVLCPGFVNTRIMDAERNRPFSLQNVSVQEEIDPQKEAEKEIFRQMIKAGISPEKVADHVFEAIRNKKFYVLTHPELKFLIELRFKDIINEQNPTLPPKPE